MELSMVKHAQIVAERFRPLITLDRSYLQVLFSSQVLDFDMEAQTQTQWCWAATSTSVSHFYSALSPWTQCKVASEAMDDQCCDSPLPAVCNQPWYLNQALDITDNFVSYQSGTITWNQVKQELEKGLVVGARTGWSGGGGHFMVIYGVSKQLGKEYLHIDDPIYGKSTLTYNQFATNYQGSGTWTHTYFTKKKLYFMWYKELILDARLLEPIFKIRPLLDLHGHVEDLNGAIPKAAFSMPHYNYNIRLDEIKKGMSLPNEPSSLRVLEADDDKVKAMYDLGTDPEHPELIQINSDSRLFDEMDHALELLKQYDSKIKGKGELRSVRVPALNLEAIWLRYPGRNNDLFKLTRSFDTPGFDSNKVYREREFTELLQKGSAVVKNMDDEMGG
jgi:hypothetical protein